MRRCWRASSERGDQIGDAGRVFGDRRMNDVAVVDLDGNGAESFYGALQGIRGSAILLHDVRELVRKQTTTAFGGGCVGESG